MQSDDELLSTIPCCCCPLFLMTKLISKEITKQKRILLYWKCEKVQKAAYTLIR